MMRKNGHRLILEQLRAIWSAVVCCWLIVIATPCLGQPVPSENDPGTRSFLYLEAYSTRFEAVVPLRTVLKWLNKVRLDDEALSPQYQSSLQNEIEAAAGDWAFLSMDGTKLHLKKATVTLVDSATAAATPFPLSEEKPTTIGNVHAALEWTWLTLPNTQVLEVGLEKVFPDQSALPLQVWTDKPVDDLSMARRFPSVQWQANHRIPQPAPLAKVPAPERASGAEIPLGLIIWIALGVVALAKVRRNRVIVLLLAVAVIIGAIPIRNIGQLRLGRAPTPMDVAKAASIVEPLLANAYSAMSLPQAEERATRMAMALDDIQIAERLRLDLAIKGHPGLLAKVRPEQLSVEITAIKPGAIGYDLEMTWTVMGTVHHLAHPDTRVNRYKAIATLTNTDKNWLLSKIQISEHRQM